MKDTSWQKSRQWYNKIVGDEGHYYHQKVVIPGVLRLMGKSKSILDVGCGQGVLERQIGANIDYLGLDSAKGLIEIAKQKVQNPKHKFMVLDATQEYKFTSKFETGVMMLSLQNMERQDRAIANLANNIEENGKIIIILNHPAFRIPRMSNWGFDPNTKRQYRRMDVYMSTQKLPIKTNPGKGEISELTWSYHYPLSYYTKALNQAGCLIEVMEEWVSDKKSTGSRAKAEDKSRSEFPLFLAIKAIKHEPKK